MTAEASIETREPRSDIDTSDFTEGIVYLMPRGYGVDGKPAYFGSDMILAKDALADGISVDYALPPEEREFIEHFSAALTIISIAVGVAGLIDPTIRGIKFLIRASAKRMGYKSEDMPKVQVDLRIDQIDTVNMSVKGLEIRGTAAAVEAALDSLNADK